MTEQILLQNKAKYRIGTVTYEVAALFNDQGEPLREKLKFLILEDIRRKTDDTFAVERKYAV